MVDPTDPAAAARALTAGVTNVHRVVLNRSERRRATPGRSARTRDVTISAGPGGVWLDVNGKAGVLFDADQWAQFTLECVALLLEIAGPLPEPSGAGL